MLQAGDYLADLSRIDDDGEHRHPASAPGAGHRVQVVDLGQQPSPGLPAVPVGGRVRSEGRRNVRSGHMKKDTGMGASA